MSKQMAEFFNPYTAAELAVTAQAQAVKIADCVNEN
jgi:hypothetical protein